MIILSIFTPKAFFNFLPTNGESSFKFDPSFTRLYFFAMIPGGGLAGIFSIALIGLKIKC